MKHVFYDDQEFCVRNAYGVSFSELRVECDISLLSEWKEDQVRFAIVFDDVNVGPKHFLAVSKLLLLKNVRCVSPFCTDGFVVYKSLVEVSDSNSDSDSDDVCIR